MITRPMLAAKLESENQIKFPVLATPKLDGIRCLIIDGKAVTRKFKAVPNHHVRRLLETLPSGLDGELMIPGKSFNDIQSAIMSEEGKPEFEYHVFDWVKDSLTEPYEERVKRLIEIKKEEFRPFVKLIPPVPINDIDSLLSYERHCLKCGFEGIIIRSKESPYKCGRSTVKEGYLLKLKRFKDSEAEVIGVEELLHNKNKAEKDEFGLTKRSKAKANLVKSGMLGAFLVKDLKTQLEFNVSTGMTEKERLTFWENRDKLAGKLIRYSYQSEGMKNLPRFPVFQGFRDERDL